MNGTVERSDWQRLVIAMGFVVVLTLALSTLAASVAGAGVQAPSDTSTDLVSVSDDSDAVSVHAPDDVSPVQNESRDSTTASSPGVDTAATERTLDDIKIEEPIDAEVYIINRHEEEYSLPESESVTLTPDNTGRYDYLTLADADTTAEIHGDPPFEGYATSVSQIEFTVLWEEIDADDDDVTLYTRAEPAFGYSFQYQSWGSPPWRTSTDRIRDDVVIERIYDTDNWDGDSGIYFEVAADGLQSRTFLSDDSAVAADPEWTLIFDDQQDTETTDQFYIPPEKVQNIDSSPELTYEITDTAEENSDTLSLDVDLNGNRIDSATTQGEHSVTLDPDDLEEGHNTITFSVWDGDVRSAGYTVGDITLEASTNAQESLQISSTPSNAGVEIDGEYVGTTSWSGEIYGLDTYDVTVDKDDYQSETFSSVDPADTDEIHADLEPEHEQVSVTTTPDGADVYLDGEYVGETPWDDELPVTETYTIEVDKDEYQSETASGVSPGDELHFDLDPEAAELSVTSTPDGADVYLDGDRVGTTPWSDDRPVTESYEVEVDAGGYESVTRSGVSAPADEHFDLDAERDTLSITSAPDDASVYLDGEYVGETPWSDDRPVTESYEVEIDADGYDPVTRTVSPPADEHVDLEADTETLSVTSTPDGADVYLDGDHVGTTPWSGDRPVTESYEIEVDKDGYEPEVRSDVSPPADEAFTLEETTGGEIRSVDHPSIVAPDGAFTVAIDTANSSSTVVEFDPDGGSAFELEPSSDDAVAIDGDRVEFLDPTTGDSTHRVDVDIDGGQPADGGEIHVWVNAEDQADADDELVSTFELGDTHPSGVSRSVWDGVTEKNTPTDDLTFQDLVDAIQAYQNDELVNGVDLAFQDLVDLITWYQSDEAGTTASAEAPSVGTASASDASVTLNTNETVVPDGETTVLVETEASAGTVVEFDPDGASVALASEDAVSIDENRVEFLDVSAGDSTYEIDVDVTGGTEGDTVDVDAWVNAEDRADADDTATGTFEIASGEASAVAGTVTNVDGDPLEDVEIEIVDPATGDVEATTRTDEDGAYLVELSPAATYELVVDEDGFDPFTTTVTIVSDEVRTIDIVLLSESDPGGEHPSGVSEELFDAVDQDDTGELSLSELRDAIADWQADGRIDDADATLGDLRNLVEWWQ